MHQASHLAEAPPDSDSPHAGQQHPPAAEATPNHHTHRSQTPVPAPNHHAGHAPNGTHGSHGPDPERNASPIPMRKDTSSSTSTNATVASSLATLISTESAATAYSAEPNSPSFATQGVFSVRDGSDVAPMRRPSRRRTGPLSCVQRERAALIRKLGACQECRRRRVAVSPHLSRLLVLRVICSHTGQIVPSEPSQHDVGRGHSQVPVAQPFQAGSRTPWPSTQSRSSESKTSPRRP